MTSLFNMFFYIKKIIFYCILNMKWLSKVDFIAPQIELTYKSTSLKRSALGGCLTNLILMFALYCIIYFGRDIVEKKKPITRFSKNTLTKLWYHKEI